MNKLRLFIFKFVVTLIAEIQRKIKYKLHNKPFFMMDSCSMNDKLKYADCSKIMESIVIGYLHTLLLKKRTSILFARLLFLNSFFICALMCLRLRRFIHEKYFITLLISQITIILWILFSCIHI